MKKTRQSRIRLEIKPLSVNEAWQGRRYKTQAYKAYEEILLLYLPNGTFLNQLKAQKDISLRLIFGVSSSNADVDNPVKPILDILQKKYGFNDRYIKNLIITKEVVKKGQEFIEISLFDGKLLKNI